MKVKVPAKEMQPGDKVGSGETVKYVGVGIRTPSGKVDVTLIKGNKFRYAQWGAYTLINVERE